MSGLNLDLELPDADATDRLAEQLAKALQPGDCVLLSGEIGAGKTHLARRMIQRLQDRPEDVPSPTFTLVQTYDTRLGELWHADLYRISDMSEIDELGLTDAFGSAICIVEWPDRLGAEAPQDALHIFLAATDDDARTAGIRATDPRWSELAGVL